MQELDKATICRRIADARRAAGLTQPELADALHVHWHTVQNWETGIRRKNGTRHWTVPWDHLATIAEICGVSMNWLVHGEEPEERDPVSGEMREWMDRIEALLKEALGTQSDGTEREAS